MPSIYVRAVLQAPGSPRLVSRDALHHFFPTASPRVRAVFAYDSCIRAGQRKPLPVSGLVGSQRRTGEAVAVCASRSVPAAERDPKNRVAQKCSRGLVRDGVGGAQSEGGSSSGSTWLPLAKLWVGVVFGHGPARIWGGSASDLDGPLSMLGLAVVAYMRVPVADTVIALCQLPGSP